MNFDSHVLDLLRVSTALVNLMTCEFAGGRPVEPLCGSALRESLGRVLVRGSHEPHVADADAALLRRFAREARPVFEAVADEDFDGAAQRVNSMLSWTQPRPRLDGGAGIWNMHFHGQSDALGEGWAAGCAAALTLALGSPNAGRLGVCEAVRCDRVYVDRSKNNTRRFCGVSCQNRVKNAELRARRR